MSLTQPPRSVRNANPGNLRKGDPWLGLSKLQTDSDFCVFISPEYGFRALAVDLHTAWARGFDNITKLISHYSPPSENNTAAYIKAVSDGMGKDASIPLDLNDPDELEQLCRAIAVHEAGGWFFSPVDLVEGVRMALKSVTPERHTGGENV